MRFAPSHTQISLRHQCTRQTLYESHLKEEEDDLVAALIRLYKLMSIFPANCSFDAYRLFITVFSRNLSRSPFLCYPFARDISETLFPHIIHDTLHYRHNHTTFQRSQWQVRVGVNAEIDCMVGFPEPLRIYVGVNTVLENEDKC